jgi:hypothetical protein
MDLKINVWVFFMGNPRLLSFVSFIHFLRWGVNEKRWKLAAMRSHVTVVKKNDCEKIVKRLCVNLEYLERDMERVVRERKDNR